ncbi:MAG: lipid-A-disaccharide synthase [Gammaproteobacteria bacterium]|nr:lipid-A-disaccharide synthase [Gammaproteobacteria bacterium]MBL6998789.1 lipid-A-disaccharide synthase [Gammaproteobacteria bacterium]
MNSTKTPHVMLLAGEASGDAHGAEVATQLFQLEPGIRLSGMGSSEMRQAGVELFFDSSSIAVMGIVEILKHWGAIKQAMELVKQQLETTRPDLLVLIDYPEFNLKMARHAKSLGIKVLFYISPQIWAWRPKRIHKIGRSIDHMAVLFKFEEQYYQKANIPVTFVGHPLVDKVKTSAQLATKKQRLGVPEGHRLVGLFPGSRNSEIARHLELVLETAAQMQQHNPKLSFVLPVAAALDYAAIQQTCSRYNINIILSRDELYDVIASCDAIVSCSGTVTLEIALLEIPLCIIYRTSWLSYQIMSRLITIEYIGLANIITGQQIVKELIQDDATPHNISQEMFRLLDDAPYRQQVQQDLKKVKQSLGKGEGARHMAELVRTLVPATKIAPLKGPEKL